MTNLSLVLPEPQGLEHHRHSSFWTPADKVETLSGNGGNDKAADTTAFLPRESDVSYDLKSPQPQSHNTGQLFLAEWPSCCPCELPPQFPEHFCHSPPAQVLSHGSKSASDLKPTLNPSLPRYLSKSHLSFIVTKVTK